MASGWFRKSSDSQPQLQSKTKTEQPEVSMQTNNH
jgi:hypothetical protein